MRRFTVMVFLMVPLVAGAASNLKPGLWEMTMKSPEMAQRKMPELTPAQREQMRKMGVEMPTMRDGGMVQRICMTKEMVERDQPPVSREHSDCKMKDYNRSGNSYSAELVCDSANLKGTGVIKGTMSGESFASTYDFKGTARGKEVSHHMESNGKWIGGDCGNVKPIGELAGEAKKKK